MSQDADGRPSGNGGEERKGPDIRSPKHPVPLCHQQPHSPRLTRGNRGTNVGFLVEPPRLTGFVRELDSWSTLHVNRSPTHGSAILIQTPQRTPRTASDRYCVKIKQSRAGKFPVSTKSKSTPSVGSHTLSYCLHRPSD